MISASSGGKKTVMNMCFDPCEGRSIHSEDEDIPFEDEKTHHMDYEAFRDDSPAVVYDVDETKKYKLEDKIEEKDYAIIKPL